MKSLKSLWAAATLLLAGCGSPVPADMFLTMSVSTRDAAVETSINGKPNDFLSGGASGSMGSSMPLNKFVHEGENELTFVLSPLAGDDIAPAFLATLEISLKGEIVDTLEPGERTMFTRELTEAETAALVAGETITLTQNFMVEKAALETIKKDAQ